MSSSSTGPEGGSNSPEPATAPIVSTPSTDTLAAERFIDAEIQRTAQNLKITQIAGTLIVLILGGYLFYVTGTFVENLRPQTAANIALGVVDAQVSEKGPDLAEQLKNKIPEYIAQTPDYVLKQLPEYRKSAEQRVEEEMTKYCQSTSDKLGTHLDKFLDEHKDNVKQLITSANDPATVKSVGDGLKAELMTYLQEKPDSGESLTEKINQALVSLHEVQAKMHRLAVAKDLTPQEKQTRHAIAVLSTAIDQPGALPRVSESLPAGN